MAGHPTSVVVSTLLEVLFCLSAPPLAVCLHPACAFEHEVEAVERLPPERRLERALMGLASCAALGDLATSARTAAALQRARRAGVLGAARLPPECRTFPPTAPARRIAATCTMPSVVDARSRVLDDLDAGTYGFLVASSRAVGGADASAPSKRLLMIALWAAALQGEAAHPSKETP